MPLALILIGTGILFIWSSLSNQGVTDTIKTVVSGGTVDTHLSSDEAPAVSSAPGAALGAAVGAAAPSTSGLDPSGHSVADLQNYAKALLAQNGWSGQWNSFNNLVNGESGWQWDISNPSHHGYTDEKHAYGIPQALPPSKMASAGADWKTNGYTQLRWMMSYIRSRYGSPDSAWSAWQSRNPHWY